MKFEKYDPVMEKGGCILRTFMKLLNKDEKTILSELIDICKEMNHKDYTDIEVFEKYLEINNYIKIDNIKDMKVKELENLSGKYACFCFKDNWYHMIPIIDNIVYDRKDDSLELKVISLYKYV